jgi:regulator of CtrA degradation
VEPSVSEPDLMFKMDSDPIQFGRTFVHSDAFKALFHEGMELVEETAAYLDGPGREDSRLLTRQGTLTYASESMRLTTRLMQVASWLLVQRAVAEGEITPDQAQAEKNRVRLGTGMGGASLAEFEALPMRLKDLIGLSARLHARILHLDQLISELPATPQAAPENPVAVQQSLLQKAFGLLNG